MTYDAMDKPLTITGRGLGSSSNISGTVTGFVYGSDGMRAKQTRSVSGVNTSTYYVDKYYEADSDGSWRAYLDDIAVLSYSPARQHLLHFTLRDRLGSGTTMADQNGVVISRRYFDPFGKTTTQSPSASLLENIRRMTYDLDIAKMQDLDVTNKNRRGFTDHEHLNEQQLIHMNGRVYDYNLGRFMSVDPLIQSPTSTQSVNPYSYIMNNPLAGTDPTGYAAESTCSTGTNVKGNNGIGCSVVGLSSGPQKKKTTTEPVSNNNGADLTQQDLPGKAQASELNGQGEISGNKDGTNQNAKDVDPKNLPPIELQNVPSYTESKKHWQEGKGRDIRIPTSAVDFSDLDISDTPQIQSTMNANDDAKTGDAFAINYNGKADNLPYETAGSQYAVLGTISLKIEGSLIKTEAGWRFSGQFKSFDDKYDFNSDWSRPVRQALTWGARKDHGEGTPYHIQIRGAIRHEEAFD
jgi:RHS repeat-associated protein